MKTLLSIAAGIDWINELAGRFAYWLSLGMVLVGALNALVRYLDRFSGLGLSSNTYIELQWYMFAALFLLAAGYTLKYDAHVRVDVLYGRLSARGRAWINVLGVALFLLPFCVLMIATSWPYVLDSWHRLEVSPDPGGLPRYPIKAVIPIAFALVMLQGISLFIRELAVLTRREPPSAEPRADFGEGV